MLVAKNDYVERTKDQAVFRVILADKEAFAAAKSYFDAKSGWWYTDYEQIEVFSNSEQINTLEDLGLKKIEKKSIKGGKDS